MPDVGIVESPERSKVSANWWKSLVLSVPNVGRTGQLFPLLNKGCIQIMVLRMPALNVNILRFRNACGR